MLIDFFMRKDAINAVFEDNAVLTENSDPARDLFNKSVFGSILKNGKVKLSLYESFFLFEKSKLNVLDKRNKTLSFEVFIKRARKLDKDFLTKYTVFKDLREKGYIIKTGLKFGAPFRVYGKGVKPGQDHALWVVFPVHESNSLTWHEFSAKARVAHSTKKKLLIGVVDDEGVVSYWENMWIKP